MLGRMRAGKWPCSPSRRFENSQQSASALVNHEWGRQSIQLAKYSTDAWKVSPSQQHVEVFHMQKLPSGIRDVICRFVHYLCNRLKALFRAVPGCAIGSRSPIWLKLSCVIDMPCLAAFLSVGLSVDVQLSVCPLSECM